MTRIVVATTWRGYISPFVSLFWGLIASIFVYFVQPFIADLAGSVLDRFSWWAPGILLAIFAIDLIVSIFMRLRHKPKGKNENHRH